MNIIPPLTLYPITNYAFGSKEAGQPILDSDEKLKVLETEYKSKGLQTTVEACILFHDHSHPHLLLLRGDGKSTFTLPGGDLKPGEEEEEGLLKRLKVQLGSPTEDEPFEIGEMVGMFYRPHFQDQMFPYRPPHITKIKQIKKIYLVHLPEKKLLAVPANMKLMAIPLMDLYGRDEDKIYEKELASLPAILSRFNYIYE